MTQKQKKKEEKEKEEVKVVDIVSNKDDLRGVNPIYRDKVFITKLC